MKQISAPAVLRRFAPRLHGFAADRRGNVLLLFSLFLVPLFLFVGAAIDYTRALDARTKMQGVVDTASLAATQELMKDGATVKQAEAVALQVFNAQIDGNPHSFGTLLNVKPAIVATKVKVAGVTTARVEIDATANIDLLIAPAGGGLKLFDLGVRSVSENSVDGIGAVSMFFALDRSGSMSWSNKMETLKKATNDLLMQLAAADPENKYVRTGAAGYNTDVTSEQKMDWGVAHTNAYTQGLVASGGTDTSTGAKAAFKALKNSQEEKLHLAKNQQVPQKFMLLLTDGDNNKSQSDTKTRKICDKAKDTGIVIFSVAFDAPSGGEKLLKDCASSEDNYFDADNGDDLLAAFQEIGGRVSQAVSRITH